MKWHFNVKRPLYILDGSEIFAGDFHELESVAGLNHSKSFAIIEDGLASYYVPENEVTKQIEFLYKNLPQTKKLFFDQLPRRAQATEKASESLLRQLKKGRI